MVQNVRLSSEDPKNERECSDIYILSKSADQSSMNEIEAGAIELRTLPETAEQLHAVPRELRGLVLLRHTAVFFKRRFTLGRQRARAPTYHGEPS
jgi:hypothetical protein